jgi:pyruvate dehydrogenase E2 component (dihydrolipoamide acetyltransferase)
MAIQDVLIPDLGDFKDVPILEILVSEGERVVTEQPLLTLESDKATMEIPCPEAGVIKEIKVNIGEKVSQGSLILRLEIESGTSSKTPVPSTSKPAEPPVASLSTAPPKATSVSDQVVTAVPGSSPSIMADLRRPKNLPEPPLQPLQPTALKKPHAGPAVRHLARQLGVDLTKVTGSGRNQRILKADVHAFVKKVMKEGEVPGVPFTGGGSGIPPIPEIDFSQFGEIATRPLSRIKKLSGAHLHRSWLNIPHVTQFDDADITELERFRKDLAEEGKKRQIKVTLLAFLLKASAAALKEFPDFNASLDASKENLILKKYYHIGVAVDTPNGLVVPVIRDVNFKGLFDLAAELGTLSQKARDGKLSPGEMQGASFTITSLGGIGGTAFTPIINAPEVAILGVSRAKTQPIYQQGELTPRLVLPLSLSYDHRVIDGAQAARFTSYLSFILSDVRRLLL